MYDIEGNLGAFGWAFQGRPHNFYSDDGMGWFHITPLTYPVSSGVYIYVLRLKHMLYILIKTKASAAKKFIFNPSLAEHDMPCLSK